MGICAGDPAVRLREKYPIAATKLDIMMPHSTRFGMNIETSPFYQGAVSKSLTNKPLERPWSEPELILWI
jgi:hypothetical protein